jgi:hypothetical protein
MLPALPAAQSPTPRKRTTKKEITVKQKGKVQGQIKEELNQPTPALHTPKKPTPAPSTPQTMTTLPKRPRVVSSELGTPTRAPKVKRMGVRTRTQKEQDPDLDDDE